MTEANTLSARIQRAAARTHRNPTVAQREAGNYPKGSFWWNGREISIETPRGAVRSGTSRDGRKWAVRMPCHYGYIRRTLSAADGDAVDVMIGPNPQSDLVCVVDQQTAGGRFDEHKAVIGCLSVQEARQLYLRCYSAGWTGLRSITPMTRHQFDRWLERGDTGKPIEGQVSRYSRVDVAVAYQTMRYSAESAKDQPRDENGRWTSEGGEVPVVNTKVFDSEPGDSFRQKAHNWAKRELAGKTFTNAATGKQINISMGGIRKTLSHLPDHGPALGLTALPQLLEQASLNSTVPVNDRNIKAWHVFESPLSIDGLPHITQLKIREDANGHYYYDQHVMKRSDPPYKLGAAESDSAVTPTGGSSASIDQDVPKDKGNSEPDRHSRIQMAIARYAMQYAKPAPAKGQREFRWITIHPHGHEEGTGTPVKIDGQGNIVGGPKGIADKGIRKLSDFGKKEPADRSGGEKSGELTRENHTEKLWEAMNKAWDSGEALAITTRTRVTPITPDKRGMVRFKNGQIHLQRGNAWDRIGGETIDHLSHQVGLPSPVSIPLTDAESAAFDREQTEKQRQESESAAKWAEFANKHFGGDQEAANKARVLADFGVDQESDFIRDFESKKLAPIIAGSGRQFIPHPAGMDDPDEPHQVVMVDPAKLDAAWQRDTPGYIGAPGHPNEIAGRRERAAAFLQSGQPIQASKVRLQAGGGVSFADGRHRFVAMRDAGDKEVGLTVPSHQADEFRKRFGVNAEASTAGAPSISDRVATAAAKAGQQSAKRELSDQERSWQEYAQNFSDVSADPPKAKSRNLHRAMGFIRTEIQRIARRLERGAINRIQHDSQVASLESEYEWYGRILKERGDYAGGGPYSDERPKPQPAKSAAPLRQVGLFSQADLGGAPQLFDTGKEFVREKKRPPAPIVPTGPSKLEQIEDELKENAIAAQPLQGQKGLLDPESEPRPKKYSRWDLAAARYARKKAAAGQQEFRWITIHPHGDNGHGTHVKIDSEGNIVAGPAGIADKGIRNLSDFGSQADDGKKSAAGRYHARGNEIFDANGVRQAAFRTAEKARDAAERWNAEGKPGEQKPDPKGLESDGDKSAPAATAQPETTQDESNAGGAASSPSPEQSGDTTPRQRALLEMEADKNEYDFARKSAVPNVGEDIKGSARHKRNEWKGLANAEENGTAEAMVTRDNLLKLEPHSLMTHADKNPLTALSMHFALRSFPAKPGYGRTPATAKDRKDFHEAFLKIKQHAEQLADTEPDPVKALDQLRQTVRAQIDDFRSRKVPVGDYGMTTSDQYNATANGLVSLAKSLNTSRRATATSVQGRMDEFARAMNGKYGSPPSARDDRDAARDYLGNVTNHARDIIEGKSLPASFGSSARKEKGFDPAELYVKIASRKGGRDVSSHVRSGPQAAKHLVDHFKLRGLQWGNSVTDDERHHHATRAVEALTDLADTLGLRPEDISLNGKLGFAIGARGHGNALAHYEPATTTINLTRAKGVGSLAHEWGHAFDHMLEGFGTGRAGARFHSQSYEGLPGMKSIRLAMHKSGYEDRLNAEIGRLRREGGMSLKMAEYWRSAHEKFARTFERYVQRKMEKAGTGNTYLAGIETKAYKSGGLWPTDAEVDAMAPAFEELLANYRQKQYGSPDPQKYSRATLRAQIAAALYARENQHKQSNGWITLGGSHVFLENGKVKRGCPGLKGVPVESLINESDESRKIREVRQAHAEARGLKGSDVTAAEARHLASPNKVKQHEAAKQAAQGSGHSTASVLRAMSDAHALHADEHTMLRPALNRAMRLSNLTPSKANRWEDSGRDWSTWPRFDDAARIVAAEHPELGLDPDDHDTPARIWDLIRDEGKRTAQDELFSPEVARTAVEMLGRPQRGQRRAETNGATAAVGDAFDADDFVGGDTSFDPDRFSRAQVAAARMVRHFA